MPQRKGKAPFLNEKVALVAVLLIFLATFALRATLSLQASGFSDDESYFVLRQAEHIKASGLPLYNDPLSYNGRTYVFTPLYEYLIAACGFFGDMRIAGTLLTQLLASLTIILVYLIGKQVSKSDMANVIAALMAAIVPSFISLSLNKLTSHALALPLLLALFYCLMRIDERRFVHGYLAALVLLTFTNQVSFVAIFGLLFYVVLVKLESLPQSRTELELLLFSFPFVLWINFLLFKKAFLAHGLGAVYQNIPSQILYFYFKDLTVVSVVNGIGILAAFYGAYGVYRYIFEEKQRKIYLLIGLVLATTTLLWLKLISLNLGLAILGLALSALYAAVHTLNLSYFSKTIFSRYRLIYQAWLVIILLITSGVVAYDYTQVELGKATSPQLTDALVWLRDNTPQNASVLGTVFDGHLITEVAQRRDVIDTNYLLVPDVSQRLDDLSVVYLSTFESPLILAADRYGFQYVLFSQNARKFYGTRFIEAYSKESDCIKLAYYNPEAKVYQIACSFQKAPVAASEGENI